MVKIEPGAIYYYHADPAETPLVMTDLSGNVAWKADYLPFGEDYQITSTHENDKMFVGKEKDKETGLYYFGARYMEAVIGRFICPDPIGAVDPKTGRIKQMIIHDPQRINFYAYGLNNPYKYVDRDGEFPIALAVPFIVAYGPVIATGIEAAVITAVTYVAAKAAVDAYNANKAESQKGSATGKKAEEAARDRTGVANDQGTEHTPKTHPEEFDPVRGSPAKRNKETGEIWVEDRKHKDHYEVYKNKKDWENRERDRAVWKDGREKEKF